MCVVCINDPKRSLPRKTSELLEHAGKKKTKTIPVNISFIRKYHSINQQDGYHLLTAGRSPFECDQNYTGS